MMIANSPRTWVDVIAELIRFGSLANNRDRGAGPAPTAELLGEAIELAKIFHRQGAPAADRVSAAVAGKIHFEWLRVGSTVVIGLGADGEAEIVSYSDRDGFTARIFRWRSGAMVHRGVAMDPLQGEAGPIRCALFHSVD